MVAVDAARRSLRTRRLVMAPIKAAHAHALHPLIDDWEVVRMLAVLPWPVPLESVEAFAAGREKPGSEEDAFAILLEGAPIGVCGVKHPGSGDRPRKMPRLGYWIGRPYWGMGFGTEAVGALAAFAFERFRSAEVIGAGVFKDNPASRRVLEKLGFRRVGGHAVKCVSRGESVPTDNMHLTRIDWLARASGT